MVYKVINIIKKEKRSLEHLSPHVRVDVPVPVKQVAGARVLMDELGRGVAFSILFLAMYFAFYRCASA
jgi:hypothetical protein